MVITKGCAGVEGHVPEGLDHRQQLLPLVLLRVGHQRRDPVLQEVLHLAFIKVDVRLPGKENSNFHGARPPEGRSRSATALAPAVQGYLAHKKLPPPLGPPYGPRQRPTVGAK